MHESPFKHVPLRWIPRAVAMPEDSAPAGRDEGKLFWPVAGHFRRQDGIPQRLRRAPWDDKLRHSRLARQVVWHAVLGHNSDDVLGDKVEGQAERPFQG